MNLTEKLVLAGLAVSLLTLSACNRRAKQGEQQEEAGEKHLLMYGQGPGPGNHYGQSDRTFDVYIYSDPAGKCYADLSKVTLWTKNNNGQAIHQTITWFSDDGNEYTVDFRPDPHYPPKRGSPFNHTDAWFTVPATGSISSADIKGGSTGYYAYAILPGHDLTAHPCAVASDPGVHINP